MGRIRGGFDVKTWFSDFDGRIAFGQRDEQADLGVRSIVLFTHANRSDADIH
jgi:hypothetical protein